MKEKQFATISEIVNRFHENGYEQIAKSLESAREQRLPKRTEKVDRRKARRLKRRMAKKVKFLILDEVNLLLPQPSDATKQFFDGLHRLTNQHLLNELNEIKHSATITQSINDLF